MDSFELPFHLTAVDPDQAWGCELTSRCSCGQALSLWERRCPQCRQKQAFALLLGKRTRVEKWLDGEIEHQLMPRVVNANLIDALVREYGKNVDEVATRKMPQRLRKEDLSLYLRRVNTFLQVTCKITSPSRIAKKLADLLDRSAEGMTLAFFETSRLVLEQILVGALFPSPVPETSNQTERLRTDLQKTIIPYLTALQSMKLFHSRLLSAYAPVRKVLERPPATGVTRRMINKARSWMHSSGSLLQFGTAIWESSEELDAMQDLDLELSRFYQQIPSMVAQSNLFLKSMQSMYQSYRLSFRKHLLFVFSHTLSMMDAPRRRQVAYLFLAKPRVGTRWLRGWYRRKAALSTAAPIESHPIIRHK